MGKNLLYVTFRGKGSGKGLSYMIDLAKIVGKGIAILVIKRRNIAGRFDALMSAITFAEAGEHEFAKEMLKTDKKDTEIDDITKICKASGITPLIYIASGDITSALRGIIKKDKSIDMVFLSPEITSGVLSVRDFKRLLKDISVPIVTMTSKTKINSKNLTEVA